MTIPELYQHFLKHRSVQTDTRKLQAGDIFFALKGPSFNGNQFAQQALEQGAALAVVDEPQYATGAKTVLVPDALEALQQLATLHRQQLNIPVLGITGSNGKTTTKELITAVLCQKFKVCATVGNLNNHIGVPLTLLRIGEDAEIAIIEMGANHRGEIASYCKMAQPDFGLITNCGKAHIEGFGGEEGVRLGKGELYDWLREHQGTVFRNSDLDYLAAMAHGIDRQITYGSAAAAYNGQVVEKANNFLAVVLQTPAGSTEINTQLVGRYNLPNVLAAVAVGSHFGVRLNDIKQAIEHYQPDNSRSQWVEKGSNRMVLDAYNANPSSMKAAIENFALLPGENKQLWLGAMKEMGAQSKAEHQALVALVKQYPWQQVLLVGEEFNGLAAGFLWFENSRQAAAYLTTNKPQEATILVKGSRGSRMEVLVAALDSN